MNATKKQGTGLAQFAATGKASTGGSAAAPVPGHGAQHEQLDRTKGKGERVNLSMRLTRGEWERVCQLAASEGVTFQQLAVKGLSRLFLEKGLPGL